jgi:hypothetical protein
MWGMNNLVMENNEWQTAGGADATNFQICQPKLRNWIGEEHVGLLALGFCCSRAVEQLEFAGANAYE